MPRGSEAPVCQPHRESREACCLPGARVQAVSERVPRLARNTGFSPFWLSDVGTDGTAKQDLGRTKPDCEALGV